MKRLAILLLLLAAFTGQAATNYLASFDFLTMTNAIAAASPGDILVLPVGTNAWNKAMVWSGITVMGTDAVHTVILDETPTNATGNKVFGLVGNLSGPMTALANVTVTHGITNSGSFDNYSGIMNLTGVGTNVLVYNVSFNSLGGKAIVCFGVPSCISHCKFKAGRDLIQVEAQGLVYGDAEWALPDDPGGGRGLYIEDCYLWSTTIAAFDGEFGARMFVRHSVGTNAYIEWHGLDSSQRGRAGDYLETYSNIWSYGTLTNFDNWTWEIHLRGGSCTSFGETNYGYRIHIGMDVFRLTDANPSYAPFYWADGTNAWDSNSGLITNLTAAAVSNACYVPGAGWTINQWNGYTFKNLRTGLFGLCNSNSADTAYFLSPVSTNFMVTFTNLDTVNVYYVRAAMDEPGMGQGANLGDAYSVTPTNLGETFFPIYAWSNSTYQTFGYEQSISSAISSSYGNVTNGQNYVNGVRPGYTSYTYPHPLVTAFLAATAGIAGGGGGGGTTNTGAAYGVFWKVVGP